MGIYCSAINRFYADSAKWKSIDRISSDFTQAGQMGIYRSDIKLFYPDSSKCESIDRLPSGFHADSFANGDLSFGYQVIVRKQFRGRIYRTAINRFGPCSFAQESIIRLSASPRDLSFGYPVIFYANSFAQESTNRSAIRRCTPTVSKRIYQSAGYQVIYAIGFGK